MLREEKIRLLTFIEVYSKLKRSAVILAALGFSYIRGNESHQEGIQCYFCHVFYPIDVEDLAHDPDCCMINENASGNIPYQTDRQFCSNFSELCANINTETEFINVAADSRHSENRLINIYNNQSQSENSLKSARCSYFNEFKNANSYLIEQPITCTDYGQSANSIKLDPECTSRQQGLQSREINVLGSVSTPVNPANAPAYLTPEANQRSLTSIKQTQPTGTNHAQQEPAANRPAGRRPGHTPTYSELGIITERPKRNDYALKIKRLESFESWPRGHHLTPNELADAGFYYTGYGDGARCFFCGGGLRNWEDEDNVWVEHARWFPKCAFIRQQKGQRFNDAVKDLNERGGQITYEMVMTKIKRVMYRVKVVTSLDKLVEEGREILSLNANTQLVSPVANQPSQQKVCKICMDKKVAVVFAPCGHLVSCADCAPAMRICPVCLRNITRTIQVFTY
ncbi:death-associated inhibitor of apoptosis 1-like [Physella acuta]|uniref:death-associated inhibitor of apoptosis 1-like n=1 Tax=Physella acuta TaxID=109671 RepID=UPI0027DBBF6E|nr:death-associated inhibitor of apoptosis 1-like [Physella acuta]XP_059147853.1 death-associated inhibitor of apoptosis 1-like [Physella acuta]